MKVQKIVAWLLFMSVWFFNIVDLIKGDWFYHSLGSILVWNFTGILAFIFILLDEAKK